MIKKYPRFNRSIFWLSSASITVLFVAQALPYLKFFLATMIIAWALLRHSEFKRVISFNAKSELAVYDGKARLRFFHKFIPGFHWPHNITFDEYDEGKRDWYYPAVASKD